MTGIRWVTIVCGILTFLVLPRGSTAISLSEDDSIQLTGKLSSRLSLRTEDSSGFTYPSVAAGNMVQHRNLLYLELNHDLEPLMGKVDLFKPLNWMGLDVKYRIVGRFLYEGVYDYGPRAFQRVQDQDKDNIDKLKQSYDLWEAYVDLSRGPFFFRLGRQNLAWGETDVFQLMDHINPLDNTYGGIFEDPDDRRIPLWMLRASYNLGGVGPLSSMSLEGFWVPGFWDALVAPWTPYGTPYSFALPEEVWSLLRPVTPDKKMANSRWGFRLSGMLGDVNFSLAHYKTFMDLPTPIAQVKPGLDFLVNPNDAWVEARWEDEQISAASINCWEPHTDAVIRAEVAWFWNEAVVIPDLNMKFSDTNIPLPPWLVDALSRAFGMDLAALGFDSIPVNPTGGEIPRKDILRYMIGFDKQIWIRPLNKTQTFLVSMQYFGQWIPDYDKRMRQMIFIPPKAMDLAAVKETESVFTGLVSTTYLNGTLNPMMIMAYDVRGTCLVQPALEYIYEPFRFKIQYSSITGKMTNFGAFRDRDQVSFMFAYLLN